MADEHRDCVIRRRAADPRSPRERPAQDWGPWVAGGGSCCAQDRRKEKDVEADMGQKGALSVTSLSSLGRAGTLRGLSRLWSSLGTWPTLEGQHQRGEVDQPLAAVGTGQAAGVV